MHDKLNKRVRAHFVFLRHFFTITSVDERLELNVIYQTMQGQEKTFQKKTAGAKLGWAFRCQRCRKIIARLTSLSGI
jgi:hypothetical protein